MKRSVSNIEDTEQVRSQKFSGSNVKNIRGGRQATRVLRFIGIEKLPSCARAVNQQLHFIGSSVEPL